ncbi:uncharacterized protein LOC129591093 isoform X2 [Paramacrobiotus metropolitanus]|uniref:uncharacterized protein LOC129591093 isoform X2 n=1 Tax=Paramacrobiotus metropolitanus TaxID=2943436 RepID=UPI0024464908|nr:uncharacterized protein LOC129591093 isoform X2 [Paramacrobiotus metropolitanus]
MTTLPPLSHKERREVSELPDDPPHPPPSHPHILHNVSSTSLLPHAVYQSQRVRVRPFFVQCKSSKVEKRPSLLSRLHTWMVCGKDPFDVDWTTPAGNLLATALFLADLFSDFAVAWYHFQEGNYGYAGISFMIFIVPIILSIGYYSVYKKYPWYFAHPFEPIYWFKKSYSEYRKVVEQRNEDMGREDAWLHFHTVKSFRTSSWARVSAVRLQVHLAALPQLLFQCYTVNELLHDRELKRISWFSWISIGLSVISLSMYHHTLALAQEKVIEKDHDQDNFTRNSPSILLDLVGQGVFDCVYIVCRAVAISCFCTVHPPWLNGLVFLTLHLAASSLLIYFAGPKLPNQFTPDFRLILYNRTNHPDILTAAVASLVLPPLINIQEKVNIELERSEHAKSSAQEPAGHCARIRRARFAKHWLSAQARTFWVAAMLLMVETEAILLFWVRLNPDHVPGHARIVTMAVISAAMLGVLVGHVVYVTFICVPIKQRERLVCIRNKGIVAKCWILELADVHYNYLQEQVMQRLINTGFTVFTRKTSNIDSPNRSPISPHPALWRVGSVVDDEAYQAPPDYEENALVYDRDFPARESNCTLTTEDLTWITETLRVVTDQREKGDERRGSMSGGKGELGLKWQRRHFFKTIILMERQLTKKIARMAQRQLDEVVRFGVVLDTEEKVPLTQECKRLITFWMEVTFRAITHQPLPNCLEDMPAHDTALRMLEWYGNATRRAEPEVVTFVSPVDDDPGSRRTNGILNKPPSLPH